MMLSHMHDAESHAVYAEAHAVMLRHMHDAESRAVMLSHVM
jgi:hypothetical protein